MGYKPGGEDILTVRLKVEPGSPLRGEVAKGLEARLPGDKSLSHRAALFGAMAKGESRIDNFLDAGVTRRLLDALRLLGIEWELRENILKVQGLGLYHENEGRSEPLTNPVRLDCGNSGTTMRLLAGALAAWGTPAVLDGSPGLRRRPMNRIIAPLKLMGVKFDHEDGRAPLTITGAAYPLRALQYVMPQASAQVKSCLLLAGLAADGVTMLREPAPSRDHTEIMLNAMGVELTSEHEINGEGEHSWVYRLRPPRPDDLKPLVMELPGDISSAAFLIVAALVVPGSEIFLRGVGLNPRRTGLLEALERMGADMQVENQIERSGEPLGDIRVRHSTLRGIHVGGDLVVRMIDEFPAFAVAAAFARGQTMVTGASELRHKESDRITALCGELGKLGAQVEELPDGFSIRGRGSLQGGLVQPYGDHRLAMALAVAGLASKGEVVVERAAIIQESFPGFDLALKNLGAKVEWVE